MKKITILTLIFSFFLSCNQKRESQRRIDSFYVNKGDLDLSRFPLIKPYEIATAIPSDNWIIRSTDDNEIPGTIPGTKDINVVDSVIFAHSKNTIVDGQSTAEAWFIIVPKHHIFRGFKKQSEYLDYIKSIKAKQPKMYDVTGVFNYFDAKDTLDWKSLNSTH